VSLRLAVLLLLPLAGDESPQRPADELAAVVAAVERGAWDEALAVAERLAEEAATLPEWMQARVRFARGVALVRREEEQSSEAGFAAAAPDFESARALAGPGGLRLDATYDLGLAWLLEAERLRGLVPEVAGAPAAMAPPAAPADGDREDPLQAARADYLQAKAAFVERLRADWRDADTRANLELIQRRLAELDEIERQREEQKQQQQDEKQGDEQKQEGEGEDGEPKDGDEKSDEQREGDANRDPSEGEEPSPDQSQDSAEQQNGEGEQPTEPQSAERPEQGEGEARPGEVSAERHLTREEVLRLLDRLGDLEEEGEALEAMLREARRVPVDRDW